jgi:3-hydroxyacyl-CoA dehydrogenase
MDEKIGVVGAGLMGAEIAPAGVASASAAE